VLIYAPDRLSRKYAYQVLLIEEFSRHGVERLFLKSGAGETPEERLLLQFQGMLWQNRDVCPAKDHSAVAPEGRFFATVQRNQEQGAQSVD
jgi:hypothetical protein